MALLKIVRDSGYADRLPDRDQLLIPSGLPACFVLGPKTVVKNEPRPRPTNKNVTAEVTSYSLFVISFSIHGSKSLTLRRQDKRLAIAEKL